jgi:amidohydrolase
LTKDELKLKVCEAIERRGAEIIALGEDIFAHPELGYKEFRTAHKVAEKFDALGLTCEKGIAVTGLKARLAGGRGRHVSMCVMGELDSVLCPGHPHADPKTGAAHSCGHNAQAASMVGVGMGLLDAGAMAYLGGDVVLVGMPAEEYVEIEYRSKLRQEGKIQFLGGKQQFIVEGALDDVDMAMMVHAGPMEKAKMSVGGSNNGFVGKFIRYRGKEAHAGGAPHAGVNALNAAMLGLMGVHAQRETLRDDDTIRIHPIITKGGDLVNIIPADVRMETYVRGKRMPAVIDAAKKVDRALRAGAMAVGAEVEIETLPGYLPRFSEPRMDELFAANAEQILGAGHVLRDSEHTTGSTDMGDIAHIMPAIHPRVGGVVGRGHSEDYQIVDKQLTYVETAKVMAMTVIDLLWDDAAPAREIVASYKPLYTKETYLKMWEDLLA